MNARFRIAGPAAIAVACAAIVLSAPNSQAGGPGAYAFSEGDRDLFPRIENSTFPPPPRASETSPWPGIR